MRDLVAFFEYRPNILTIEYEHETWDMSIHNVDRDVFDFEASTLKKGQILEIRDQKVRVEEVTDEKITLFWGHRFDVIVDEDIVTNGRDNENIYLSYDYTTLKFSYHFLCAYEKLMGLLDELSEPTDEDKQFVYDVIDVLIEVEEYCYYPLLALLKASDDWDSYEIVRRDEFRQILRKGIEKGCLGPEEYTAWYFMMNIVDDNDYNEIFEDKDEIIALCENAVKDNSAAKYILKLLKPEPPKAKPQPNVAKYNPNYKYRLEAAINGTENEELKSYLRFFMNIDYTTSDETEFYAKIREFRDMLLSYMEKRKLTEVDTYNDITKVFDEALDYEVENEYTLGVPYNKCMDLLIEIEILDKCYS